VVYVGINSDKIQLINGFECKNHVWSQCIKKLASKWSSISININETC